MYKNNVDGKGASYGTHENYLCSRDTPFPAIIAGLTPFFASRQVFAGAGRVGHRAVRADRGLPARPALRLHRGRGRPGDHAEARHHQHPGRTARRRRQAPPAARHHRRRQPGRDRHLPQARHRRAGAVDDRIEVADARRRAGPPGRRRASDLPRPDPGDHRAAGRRPPVHRPGHPARLPRVGRQVRRGASTATTWTSRPAMCWTAGSACWTGWSATRWTWPTSWTGRRNCGCWRVSAAGTGCPGGRTGWPWSTCSTPTCARTRACTTGWCSADR